MVTFQRGTMLLVSTDADPRVSLGDVPKPGAISKVDVTTGKLTQIATGFSAADGLAVAHDGTTHATNDFGGMIGRVIANGQIACEWAYFVSANGAVLSHDRPIMPTHVGGEMFRPEPGSKRRSTSPRPVSTPPRRPQLSATERDGVNLNESPAAPVNSASTT